MDSNTTSVAVRQRPRANHPGGSGRSGTLPTLPAPTTINVPLPNPRAIPNSSTNNPDGSLTVPTCTSIDNGHSKTSHVSTNPFSQPPVCAPNSAMQSHHSSEIISSNPFVASSHTGE